MYENDALRRRRAFRPWLITALIICAVILIVGPYVWREYHREAVLTQPQTVTIANRGGGFTFTRVDIAFRNVEFLHPGDSTTFEALFFVTPVGTTPCPARISAAPSSLSCNALLSRWRPVSISCSLLTKLDKIEIPPVEREVFDSERKSWENGNELPEHHDWSVNGVFDFSLAGLIGYFHRCSWVVSFPNSEGRHVLVYRATLDFKPWGNKLNFGKYVESETLPIDVEVAEPLVSAGRISSYLGILTAAVALFLQLGLWAPKKNKG